MQADVLLFKCQLHNMFCRCVQPLLELLCFVRLQYKCVIDVFNTIHLTLEVITGPNSAWPISVQTFPVQFLHWIWVAGFQNYSFPYLVAETGCDSIIGKQI